MGIAFPSFKYSDIITPGYTYGGDKSLFTKELDLQPGVTQSPQTSDLTDALNVFREIRREERDPAYRKQILEDQLAFQREQMKQAAPYKMLFELPGQVMQAFAVPAQIRSNIMLAGQGAANQLLAQGLQSSAYNMPGMGYERPSTRYFS